MCLSIIFLESFGESTSLTVFPNEDITISYGNPVEIFCVAEDGYSSQDLEFVRGFEHLNTSKVNETTLRLFLEKPDIGAYVFYCSNKKTRRVSSSRVIVDKIPSPVTNFKCISKNLDEMKCSWVPPKSNTDLIHTLNFLIYGRRTIPCNVVLERNLSSCTWSATYGAPLYRQQLDKYLFEMKTCNAIGCINQNFTIDHFSIVKPNKPKDLQVINAGTHSITLKWRIPYNMVDFLEGGIEHKIVYQIAEIDDPSHFHEVDATDLPPENSTYLFELTNLPYANRQYEVRIYIRPKKAKGEEFWSDYAYKIFNTASERPQHPPEIAAGAFHQMVYKNHRLINVF